MIGCKHTGEIEYDLNKALVVVPLKRKLKAFYYFSRLYLHFPDFFQVWKITEKISRLFFEEFMIKTLYEP